MARYSKNDFEQIAAAIGKDVNEIMRHERQFANAATSYALARKPRKVKKTSKAKAASPSEKDEMSSGNHKTPSEVRKSKTPSGRKAGTSIIAPSSPRRGKAAGPLPRFLQAAGAPLGIRYSPDSWRARVRDNQTGGRRK